MCGRCGCVVVVEDDEGKDAQCTLSRDARDFVGALELELATAPRLRRDFVRDLETYAETDEGLRLLLRPVEQGDSLAHNLVSMRRPR